MPTEVDLSQSYGFSSSHVWMWELDHKESWVPKNWCFWTVVLKNILESPLDCKEIQPVHPKENQSWTFIGRTDSEAETPIIWPPDAKNQLIGKKPWCLERQKAKGKQRMTWLDSTSDSMDMNLSKLEKIVEARGTWGPAAHGVAKSQTWRQFSSVAQLCPTLCDPVNCSTPASLTITNCWSLLKLTSIQSVMPPNHLIFCHPLLLQPSICPSFRVFSNESAFRIRWPNYWSFSFSINPSNEHPGLIFRMDWLALLGVQRTLRSLLQHHSSKASILWCLAFFTVPL